MAASYALITHALPIPISRYKYRYVHNIVADIGLESQLQHLWRRTHKALRAKGCCLSKCSVLPQQVQRAASASGTPAYVGATFLPHFLPALVPSALLPGY